MGQCTHGERARGARSSRSSESASRSDLASLDTYMNGSRGGVRCDGTRRRCTSVGRARERGAQRPAEQSTQRAHQRLLQAPIKRRSRTRLNNYTKLASLRGRVSDPRRWSGVRDRTRGDNALHQPAPRLVNVKRAWQMWRDRRRLIAHLFVQSGEEKIQQRRGKQWRRRDRPTEG